MRMQTNEIPVDGSSPRSRLFTGLALTTVLMTLGLIVFGAVVRVTDSGLGCGNEWPLCDGTVIPPMDNVTAWIEWLHRLFAALIGLFGLGTLYVALRAYRAQNRLVLWATVVAALLFTLQSALGAFVVIYDLPPTMVTMHLGTAMLLLGALLLATIGAWYQPTTRYARDHVTLLAYVTAGLTLVIILTGALVRGAGATLACADWPLCNGEILPFSQGQLQVIHVTHRFAVFALGLSLLLLTWYVFRARQHRLLRTFTLLSVVTFFGQALVGGIFVLTSASPLWGAAHVGTAALTWAFLVSVSVIDTYNSLGWTQTSSSEEEQVWNTQSQQPRSLS